MMEVLEGPYKCGGACYTSPKRRISRKHTTASCASLWETNQIAVIPKGQPDVRKDAPLERLTPISIRKRSEMD
jgi:hypothetical protein